MSHSRSGRRVRFRVVQATGAQREGLRRKTGGEDSDSDFFGEPLQGHDHLRRTEAVKSKTAASADRFSAIGKSQNCRPAAMPMADAAALLLTVSYLCAKEGMIVFISLGGATKKLTSLFCDERDSHQIPHRLGHLLSVIQYSTTLSLPVEATINWIHRSALSF